MTEAALGIDLGLTGARAALVATGGGVLARSTRPASGDRPVPADAGAWPDAVAAAAREALSVAGPVRLVAVCIAAAGPQPIPVDADLRPLLEPCLTAIDRRPGAERARLASLPGVTSADVADNALPLLDWWRERHPEAFARARTVLDATGYLVARLTGRPAMDRITRDDYRLAGVEPPLPLPDVVEPHAFAGALTADAAAALGARPGIPVTAGTYDSWVDLDAVGGEGRLLLGSTMILAVTGAAASSSAPDLRGVALPGGEPATCGWTSAAGSTIAWARDRFGAGGGGLEPGAGGVLALPYLAGERTPVWDALARGAVVGLTTATSSAQMGRAFLDAVALSARDVAERMRAAGLTPQRWRVGGGGVKDRAWLQATSDALDARLDIVDVTGGAGAALFALRAAGFDPGVPVVETIEPRAAMTRRYDALYPLYRDMYPALRTTMAALAGLGESGPTSDFPAPR